MRFDRTSTSRTASFGVKSRQGIYPQTNGDVPDFNDVGAFEIHVKISAGTVPGQIIVYHAWEPYMFKNGHSHQTVTPSPINPIELAGQYFHLRPMFLSHSPGENDRGVRIEVEKAKGAGATTGMKI